MFQANLRPPTETSKQPKAFYVNGVETFPDTSSPVLPMNGVRRINMGDTNVRIYRISRDLAVGDLMAMQVNSRLASVTWDEMLATDGSKEGGGCHGFLMFVGWRV